jgi:hypothetical protein
MPSQPLPRRQSFVVVVPQDDGKQNNRLVVRSRESSENGFLSGIISMFSDWTEQDEILGVIPDLVMSCIQKANQFRLKSGGDKKKWVVDTVGDIIDYFIISNKLPKTANIVTDFLPEAIEVFLSIAKGDVTINAIAQKHCTCLPCFSTKVNKKKGKKRSLKFVTLDELSNKVNNLFNNKDNNIEQLPNIILYCMQQVSDAAGDDGNGLHKLERVIGTVFSATNVNSKYVHIVEQLTKSMVEFILTLENPSLRGRNKHPFVATTTHR